MSSWSVERTSPQHKVGGKSVVRGLVFCCRKTGEEGRVDGEWSFQNPSATELRYWAKSEISIFSLSSLACWEKKPGQRCSVGEASGVRRHSGVPWGMGWGTSTYRGPLISGNAIRTHSSLDGLSGVGGNFSYRALLLCCTDSVTPISVEWDVGWLIECMVWVTVLVNAGLKKSSPNIKRPPPRLGVYGGVQSNSPVLYGLGIPILERGAGGRGFWVAGHALLVMTVWVEWGVGDGLVENFVLSGKPMWWLSCCWEKSLSSRGKSEQGPEPSDMPEWRVEVPGSSSEELRPETLKLKSNDWADKPLLLGVKTCSGLDMGWENCWAKPSWYRRASWFCSEVSCWRTDHASDSLREKRTKKVYQAFYIKVQI